MTEDGEESEAMHVHEDYQTYPYQPPTLTSDQQQQIEEDLAFITRKGLYPYKYVGSFELFQEPQLPPKDAFYSSLTEKNISETDNTHTQRLFNYFSMTDPGHYHNFCLLTDVLLMADLFENFRDMCLQHYDLNPPHNYTSPGLSWQAALKMMDVKLNLLTDIDQHLIEEVMRGGVAMISHQYARTKASGKQNCDASKRNSYIMYLGTNNLYGWTMSQPLPTSSFKYLTDKEIEELDMMMVTDDSSRGYILESDLGKHYFYYHMFMYIFFLHFMFFPMYFRVPS